MPHGRLDLETDRLVGFAKEFASLGVAEFDDIHAAVDQHQRRNLACPGAGFSPVHVLGTDLHGTVLQHRLDFADRSERRDDETLQARIVDDLGAGKPSAKLRASASVLFIFQLVPIQKGVSVMVFSPALKAAPKFMQLR